MKIVYVIYSISKLTGIERMFVSQMNYLAERYGYDMTLLTYDQGIAPDAYSLSAKVTHIDYSIKTFHVYKYPVILRPLIMCKWHRQLRQNIKKTISEIKPDIVVCSSYEKNEMQIVLSLEDVKHVVQVHSSYYQSGGQLRSRHIESSLILWYKKNFVFRRVVKLVRRFDSIITLTNGDAEMWHSEKVKVIPNPLVVTASPNQVEKARKVVAVGSLLMVKGFDMLLDAWEKIYEKHPDWQLEITGEGVEAPFLLRQMQKMRNVKILPKTSDIASRYLSGEIFVMTSRFEGFGLVLLEAMSFGLAPISFDCDFGPREIITDGWDGILVPLGDTVQLSDRLHFLMTNDDERRRLGQNAIEKSKKYHEDKIMPQFSQLYESLISSGL